jgi:uracil-DNA glycosylase
VALLERVEVVVALGAFGWDAVLRMFGDLGHAVRPKPRFGHGAEAIVGPYRLIGSYHPSQQNTFTGRLTPSMFDAVIQRASEIAGVHAQSSGPCRLRGGSPGS